MTNVHPVMEGNLSAMDDDALAAAVSTLAAHIHAATYRLLTLIAEFDRREVWAAQGAMSCAHWLSWACGIDTHTAREKVRVARALTELPLLSEALAKGELGPTAEAARDLGARHHRHPERIPRDCHRLGDGDRALARRAHRLRPRIDGRDGVVGFGRHRSGGGTGGG